MSIIDTASIELLTKSEIMLLSRIKILNNRNKLHNFISFLHNRNVELSNVSATSDMDMEKLPKLPLPKLEQTMEKYLKTVQPFLNSEEYENTKKLVKDFQNGPGKELQQLLEERAKNYDNWLADWWLDTAYLSYRDPVVIYSSPGLVFPFENFHNNEEEQLNYTAKLILAALNYKQLIDSGRMMVEKMGKSPLDMNQYNKIFGTCRIPGVKVDHLEYNPQSTHIVIVKNNNFFKVNVLDSSGATDNLPCFGELLNCLKEISKQSKEPGPSIGILTADDRNSWGRFYQDLILNPNNLRSIRAIQTCLFLICLDKPLPKATNNNEEQQRSNASKQTIHGGGSLGNAANRWYDKTIQFIVGIDGTVGLTYEHSPSEGQPIAVMTDFLIEYIKNNRNINITDGGFISGPEQLKFYINDKIQQGISHATNTIDKLVDRFDMDAFQFKQFGKEFVKSQKLSPDSFIQIAMQCAFYRLHKVPGGHYESAATRKFIHGRTETIRSCSNESINFAKILTNNPIVCNHEKFEALNKAINSHKNYTIDALNGYGIDRHLLGLKLIAIENGLNIPELYKHPSYTRSAHMRISTSQVATKCDAWMCYGPLTYDGYGCCYNPRLNDINFAVSAWIDNPETNANQFRQALEMSLIEMQQILIHNQKSKL